MDCFKNFVVHYNGQFSTESHYIGGDERIVMIPSNDLTIHALRSQIQYILDADSIVGDYTMYYLATSEDGRSIPSIVATDMHLQQVCSMFWQPTIYCVMNVQSRSGAGIGQREPSTNSAPQQQSPYRPLMASFSPPPHGNYSPTAEDIRRFGSSMMFSDHSSGSRSSSIPNLNENPPSDDDDEDYVVMSDEDDDAIFDSGSSEGDERDATTASIFNCTVEDFANWVRQHGGMSCIVSSLLPTHQLPAETSGVVSNQFNNWLLPIIPIDISDSPMQRDLDAVLDSEIANGSIFSSKEDLYIAVGLWHMENRVEFKVSRSSTTVVEYTCSRSQSCPFLVRARNAARCWMVRRVNLTHSCIMSIDNIHGRSIRSKAVAAYYAKKMRQQGSIIKPRDIIADLQHNFGINMSYSNALRARNGALSMIYGGIADSFAVLPKYMEVLRQYNPGTCTDIDIDDDGRLRHFFVCLGVSRVTFSALMRQVIVVDATHLKGRNKGVLLVAVTKDGNEQIFPLALGFARIENDESWTWFMSRLRMAFGPNNQLLIVSDQHISIANAINAMFPEATHGLCCYHLQNKLTSYGPAIVRFFQNAAYAYRPVIFQSAMEQIKQHCPTAFDRLMMIGPEKWARSQCPVRRYSFMTSNAAEVLNSRLLDARRLPICSIVEVYRHIIEKWFDERRARANARTDSLTETIVAKLSPVVEISNTYQVFAISQHQSKVNDGQRTWMVDLHDRLCDCSEFQGDLIPCSHAIAAIRTKGKRINDYVSSYYTTTTWREIYGGVVHSLPPKDEWEVSQQAQSCVVLPPIIHRQAGRPRNSRRPSGAEAGQSSSSRQRAHKKCSICRSSSHTKRACPNRIS